MKLKALFILHEPPPVHGAAMVGQWIKESEVINNAFDIDYINLSTSLTLSEIGKNGRNKFSALYNIQKQIWKALKSNTYEVCYMTLTSSGAGFYKDFFIVMTLKLFKQNIVFHFHNKGVAANSNHWLQKKCYTYVFKNIKCIMLSPKLYSDISSYVKPEDVFYCPNGVPCLREKINQVERTKTTELSSLKEYVETQEEPLIHFLFLSNMMRMKGVFTLIEACGILAKEGIDFRCNFVGAWSDVDEQQFNEQVVAHGAEKVIAVHGKKYGDDKISFFKEADVFVHPTHADCFPLVLLEAMQFGLPIIASNEGAIGDMVSKENGCLVKVGHAGELAAKMKILLQNPEIRQKMGKLGQQRFIDEFTLTKFEDRFMNIIKQTI